MSRRSLILQPTWSPIRRAVPSTSLDRPTGEISQPESPERSIHSTMSRITTQELRRSHTSPTQVNTPIPANTPIPVDTPTNPFSPTHMEPSSLQIGTEFHAQTMAEDVPPTFYPGAESSWIPSHYLPKDKGNISTHTATSTNLPRATWRR